MSELSVECLRHVYSAGTPFEKVAIDNIDLTIRSGEMVGIIGHTGSGKSTFIQHLNALLQPTSGRILLDGKDINADKFSRRDVKWRVGLVFQYPEYQLFEETVYKDIAFGPKNQKLSEQEIDSRVRMAASFTGIDEELFGRSPLELSGGQKRRIAIAGVIAMQPDFLILDEPTAGLDPRGCDQILDNVMAYREKTGAAILIVSHNMDDVARLCERIIVFDGGRIAMDGSPEEVFAKPEKLMAMGLSIPHASTVALELRMRGMKLDRPVYTHEQLLQAVLRAKEAGKC